MSVYLDKQYIQQISPRLEKFKWKSSKVSNFRCPICLDSEKSKIKKRAFFYQKGNDFFFKCHNCLVSTTLANFLKDFDPHQYEQYIFDRYRNGDTGHSNVKKPEFDFKWTKPNQNPKIKQETPKNHFEGLPTIESLRSDHAAKKYLVNRKIPKEFLGTMYFTDDFKSLADELDPENEFTLPEDDERIVIPFIDQSGNLIAFQGRTINKKNKLRYITIKVDKDAPKIYGLDRVDMEKPVYILEGPFDAMFIPNAIATGGAKMSTTDLAKIPTRVWVFDNERRSPDIVGAMSKMAKDGESVCVWPETISQKDVNKMVEDGITPEKILEVIKENTHTGLNASFAISEWKRV